MFSCLEFTLVLLSQNTKTYTTKKESENKTAFRLFLYCFIY